MPERPDPYADVYVMLQALRMRQAALIFASLRHDVAILGTLRMHM